MGLFCRLPASASTPFSRLAVGEKVTLDTPMSVDANSGNSPDQPAGQNRELTQQIRQMRRSYGEAGLHESTVATDPIAQFTAWLKEAAENPYIVEANAMVLSTIESYQSETGPALRPASRTVLLKGLDGQHGDEFTFFTNYESAKALQIAAHSEVSLLFPWYAMERQVIVKGFATKVSQQVTDEYFASRPCGSKIGAWASSQSRELASREELEAAYKNFAQQFPEGSVVPTPPHWGGYCVRPIGIEFWQGRYSRLHDRLIFTREHGAGSSWEIGRLYP